MSVPNGFRRWSSFGILSLPDETIPRMATRRLADGKAQVQSGEAKFLTLVELRSYEALNMSVVILESLLIYLGFCLIILLLGKNE